MRHVRIYPAAHFIVQYCGGYVNGVYYKNVARNSSAVFHPCFLSDSLYVGCIFAEIFLRGYELNDVR